MLSNNLSAEQFNANSTNSCVARWSSEPALSDHRDGHCCEVLKSVPSTLDTVVQIHSAQHFYHGHIRVGYKSNSPPALQLSHFTKLQSKQFVLGK